MILEVNPNHPQPRKIERVMTVLRDGGLVAYPTDTVYGIGCDIFNRNAVDRLHRLVTEVKGGESKLAFICPDLRGISEYAYISDYAYRVMKHLLPGPYTFILQATKVVPKVMLTKRKTIGIRVPDAPIPLGVVQMLGNPIATTSASLPDGELIADPWTLDNLFGHAVDLVVDGGFLFPEPSSVIDFTTDLPQVIRHGKGDVSLFEEGE